MTVVNWDTLRAEAFAGNAPEPFIIEMPDGDRIEIPSLPAGVFTADFDLVQDGTLNSILLVLEQVLGKRTWDRMWPALSSEPIEVVVKLFDTIIDHFNATVDSGN